MYVLVTTNHLLPARKVLWPQLDLIHWVVRHVESEISIDILCMKTLYYSHMRLFFLN